MPNSWRSTENYPNSHPGGPVLSAFYGTETDKLGNEYAQLLAPRRSSSAACRGWLWRLWCGWW